MKRILIQLSFIVSAFLMISCMSCSKDSGEGNGGELIVEPKPEMNLLDLFYSLVDEQSETGTRSKVFVVAHRANTFEGVRNNVPDNSITDSDRFLRYSICRFQHTGASSVWSCPEGSRHAAIMRISV